MPSVPEIRKSIKSAEALDELSSLEKAVHALQIGSETKELLLDVIDERKEGLVQRRRSEGTYFEDAANLFYLKEDPIPTQESQLEKSFDFICRKETPLFYLYIKKAAEDKAGGKLQSVCTKSLGSNSQYPKGKTDMFDKPIDPSKAHIFLDSKTCGPSWGHSAEGATGKIENTDDNHEKNQIRALRMMGGKQNEKDCLRRDVHNYIPLHNEHRIYYDGKPQLLILPCLTYKKIMEWKGEPYDFLVMVASAHDTVEGLTCADIYRTILSNFSWDRFDEEKNVGSPGELDNAFKMLRHFIRGHAHSLLLGIPQDLLDLAENTGSSSSNNNSSKQKGKKKKSTSGANKPPPSPRSQPSQEEGNAPTKEEWLSKKAELERAREKLENQRHILLPYFKPEAEGLRPVLKLRFDGPVVPDPWLLMAKAAVNFSWIAYGFKLLPACLPPPDEANEEYEEALLEYEQRQRGQRHTIPTALTIPATPVTEVSGDHVATVTPPGGPRTNRPARVTPPSDKEGGEEKWETLSNSSY